MSRVQARAEGMVGATAVGELLSSVEVARPRASLNVLHFSFATFLVAIWVGLPWDFYYHTSRTFETFATPPHMVIYGGMALAAASALDLVRTRALRQPFGAPVLVWGRALQVPGPLLLLLSGLSLIATAGAIDSLWHGAFGQNETNWSLPHALLAWGIFVSFLGYLSARLALTSRDPMSTRSKALFSFFAFPCAAAALVGPFLLFSTPAQVAALFATPGFSQPSTQSLFRVVVTFDLMRDNPLYAGLWSLWTATVLNIVRLIDARPKFFLALAAAGTATYSALAFATAQQMGDSTEAATLLAPPFILAAAIVLAAERLGQWPAQGWAVAGAAMGLWAALVYAPSLPSGGLFIIGGSLGGWVGYRFGTWLAQVAREPGLLPVRRAALAFGAGVPMIVGVIDLYMRTAAF